jgi:tetratricopeptide (TPR) repeat protein
MPTPRLARTRTPTLDHFTREEVLRMVGITPQQITRWERLRLVEPQAGGEPAEKVYTFADLVSLRTLKQLTGQGISEARLLDAIQAVGRQLGGAEVSLAKLRISSSGSSGRNLVIEYDGKTLEPFSGQLLLKFEAGATKLRPMRKRSAGDWLALALESEGDPSRRLQAIDAYRHVVELAPNWVEPHINMGTLLYEQGELPQAAESYRRALALDPANALAHFDLGSVLDELKKFGDASHHLREAVRLKPDYADAHYNLARVLEELGAYHEARPHWRRYLELDPNSSWAKYARERLKASEACG